MHGAFFVRWNYTLYKQWKLIFRRLRIVNKTSPSAREIIETHKAAILKCFYVTRENIFTFGRIMPMMMPIIIIVVASLTMIIVIIVMVIIMIIIMGD